MITLMWDALALLGVVIAAVVVLGVRAWLRDRREEREERALFAAYFTPKATRAARCVASPARRPPGATEISHEWLAAPPDMGPGAGVPHPSPVTTATCAGAHTSPKVDSPAPAGTPSASMAPPAALGAPRETPGLESEASGPPVPAPVPDGFGATYAYVRAIQELTTEDYLASLARPWAEDTGAFLAVTTGWS